MCVRSYDRWANEAEAFETRDVFAFLKFKSVGGKATEKPTEINYSRLAWSPFRRTSETMANLFLFDIAQKERSNFDWQNEHSEREERLFRKVAFCDFIVARSSLSSSSGVD